MFRGTKKKRWGVDEAAALYRGVLRRDASPAEADALARAVSAAGTPERALVDMLSSHEFGVMVLPNLINEFVASVPRAPVFFLHVPKTAGTSFRLALSDNIGLPAFLAYVSSSWLGYGKNDTMNFWPLWAGHAGISAFPETHRGITVFRESRSRMLSTYRQQERELALKEYSMTRFSRDEGLMKSPNGVVTAADPFSEWIKFNGASLQWFLDAPSRPNDRLWDGRPTGAWARSLGEKGRRAMVARNLERFDAAAWSHDSAGMSNALEKIVGKPNQSGISVENTFAPEPTSKPTVLRAEDLAHLERIAREDSILTDLAAERGLIPPLDSTLADELFETTATRLGFTFG